MIVLASPANKIAILVALERVEAYVRHAEKISIIYYRLEPLIKVGLQRPMSSRYDTITVHRLIAVINE